MGACVVVREDLLMVTRSRDAEFVGQSVVTIRRSNRLVCAHHKAGSHLRRDVVA
jgi:hypothetical protein